MPYIKPELRPMMDTVAELMKALKVKTSGEENITRGEQ